MTANLVSALLLTVSPMVEHTFRYPSGESASQVSVVGSFNQWNRQALTMVRKTDGWEATAKLPMGRHSYKFVLDGSRWILDPKNPHQVTDGAGNVNSVAIVLPPDYANAAKAGDGIIAKSVISPRQGYDQGRILLNLSVRPGDIERVSAVVQGKTYPLKLERTSEFLAHFTTALKWDKSRSLSYYFIVEDAKTRITVDAQGVRTTSEPKPIPVPAQNLSSVSVPTWVESSVFYQIFPDRFANGDSRNDPAQLEPWGATPTYANRFGGDAEGIRKNISYLKNLGVNAVYLNPIMMANSNHRYDPVDFFTVDPEFGTNQEFIRLSEELDRAGIRTVLDQIFDHVGVTFSPFTDVLRHQARSRFRDWFFVRSFPIEVKPNPTYEAWYGFESMPKLNVLHPAAKGYLLESVRFWMQSAKLSGWRLDVANEVPKEFWREFRSYVKSIDPDAWIVGEVWTDASEWLGGDQWDASMNYPFRTACIDWIAQGRGTSAEFLSALSDNFSLYAPQVSRNQLNLLSSHDTPRFLTEAGGRQDLAKLAATVQFTWPGVPSVYYGEELGMEGGVDPANRRGMEWHLVSESNFLLAHYVLLSTLKTNLRVLAAGAPEVQPNASQPDVAVFLRRYGSEVAATVINRGKSSAQVEVQFGASAKTKKFIDAFTGSVITTDARGVATLKAGPVGSVLLIEATRSNLELVTQGRKSLTALIQRRNSHVQ